MGLIIEDGGGRGYSASISNENKLHVDAMTHTTFEHQNQAGNVFSVLFSKTPAGANNCFFYFKNTSSNDVWIKNIKLHVPSTGERVQVIVNNVGIPANGTVITPVNKNTGSGNKAQAVIEEGTNITGLSGGSVVQDFTVAAAGDTRVFELDTLIIAPGTTFCLYAVAGSIAIRGGISFAYVPRN